MRIFLDKVSWGKKLRTIKLETLINPLMSDLPSNNIGIHSKIIKLLQVCWSPNNASIRLVKCRVRWEIVVLFAAVYHHTGERAGRNSDLWCRWSQAQRRRHDGLDITRVKQQRHRCNRIDERIRSTRFPRTQKTVGSTHGTDFGKGNN